MRWLERCHLKMLCQSACGSMMCPMTALVDHNVLCVTCGLPWTDHVDDSTQILMKDAGSWPARMQERWAWHMASLPAREQSLAIVGPMALADSSHQDYGLCTLTTWPPIWALAADSVLTQHHHLLMRLLQARCCRRLDWHHLWHPALCPLLLPRHAQCRSLHLWLCLLTLTLMR